MNKLEKMNAFLGSTISALGAHTRMAVLAVATVFLLFGGIPSVKISDDITLPGYGQSADALQYGTALKVLKFAKLATGLSAAAAWEFASFIKRTSDSAKLRSWEADFWLWVDTNKDLLDIGDSDCAPLAKNSRHYATWKWCIAKHYKDIVDAFLKPAKECEWDWFGSSRALRLRWEIHHTDSTKWACYSYLCEHYKGRWSGPCPKIFRPDLIFDGDQWRRRVFTSPSGPQ